MTKPVTASLCELRFANKLFVSKIKTKSIKLCILEVNAPNNFPASIFL